MGEQNMQSSDGTTPAANYGFSAVSSLTVTPLPSPNVKVYNTNKKKTKTHS